MFESARQKVERAEYHILDLERQLTAFVAAKPHRFVAQSDLASGDLLIKVRFLLKMPSSFALIIGDTIHNLRCALDHAIWEVVGIDGGAQDRYLKFPTGDCRVNFEASCQGIVTPSQWLKDSIRASEAFIGGKGVDIFNLHHLDNADKHTAITPVLRATGHPPMRVYNQAGNLMASLEGNVVIGGTDEEAALARFGRGLSIELDNDAECPPNIFFSHPNVGLSSPAIPTLRRMQNVVVNTLDLIEGSIP